MELSPWLIYLIGIADNFQDGLQGIIVLSIITIVVCLFIIAMGDDEYIGMAITCIKGFIAAIVISCIGLMFIPNSKTLAAMYVLPAIVNNEQVQDITKNALDLTADYLKELLTKKGTE